MRTNDARVRRDGFSLVELMVVVVITGILAATAIPTFTEYIYKSRTTEAVSFLGVMKLRQEAFRAEFGNYLTCSGMIALSAFDAASSFAPPKGTSDRDRSISWNATEVGTNIDCFNTLGASPDGPVRFRYAWIAGTPANFAGSGVGSAPPNGLGVGTADHYFVGQAHADLDNDGTWCVFELSNFTRNVWIGDEDGNDLASGWE